LFKSLDDDTVINAAINNNNTQHTVGTREFRALVNLVELAVPILKDV